MSGNAAAARRYKARLAGRPLGPDGYRLRLSVEERFWLKVDRSGGAEACWVWLGAADGNGYGRFYVSGGRQEPVYRRAHRFAYELLVGPVPDGLDLDHLCRVRACVNPTHLEPVTSRENTLRGISPSARRARQTHCSRGHEFTIASTYVDRRGRRSCRPCRAAWARQRAAA